MNERIKESAGIIYNVVISVLLAVSVGLVCWTADKVIEHERELGKLDVRQQDVIAKVDIIETHGSRSLEAHIKDDDTRVAEIKDRVSKVETAILSLQNAATELKAVNVRLDTLKEGEERIERAIEKSKIIIP
jgi:hypothetical protein